MDWLLYASQVNWLAVLLAVIATMAIGFVWYMPAVLGNRWMAAIGKTEDDLRNIRGYGSVGCHHRGDVLVPRTTSAKDSRR